MKAFFTVGVVAALLMIAPLELQAAPHGIASHAMGQAVEELKQLIQSMKEKAGANYYGGYYDQSAKSMGEGKANYYGYYNDQNAKAAQANYELAKLKQLIERSLASAQVTGIDIQNCGFVGNIINFVLQAALAQFSSSFGVLVDCRGPQGCLQVRVDVPAETRKAEVNVCPNRGAIGGGSCVRVLVETPCPPGQGITIPISIPGAVDISITIGQDCADVEVTTGLNPCPPGGR